MRLLELCTPLYRLTMGICELELEDRRKLLNKLNINYFEKREWHIGRDGESFEEVKFILDEHDVKNIGGQLVENGFERSVNIYWRRKNTSKKPYKKHIPSCTFAGDEKCCLLLIPSNNEEYWIEYYNPF